jgi:DNA-binding Lrp family transcriptional regulator
LKQKTAGLSVRILKELTSPASFQWNFRESYASLAKRLEVDEETLRLTLKKAMDEGLVKGWRLVINPNLFGHELSGLQLEVDHEERKQEVIEQLKLIEGVILLLDFHGNGLRVIFYHPKIESAIERKVKLIASICGFQGETAHWDTKLPLPDIKLRSIDWQILQVILRDPRMEVALIAKKVGVSTRTISRRLRLMTESHVAYLIPIRDVRKSKGVLAVFLIGCPEEQKRLIEAETKERGQQVDFVYTTMKNRFLISILAENVAIAEDLLVFIKNTNGVSSAKLDVMKDFIFVDEWLNETIGRLTSH